MKCKIVSVGEVRNNFRKYIYQLQEDTSLSLIISRRVNQYSASKDTRFLCIMSGEQYQELYRKAYGEDAEREMLRGIGALVGNDAAGDE